MSFTRIDAEREEEQEFSNVHILDLKTLTAALTGEAYTFSSASEIFGAPASRARKTSPTRDQTGNRATAEECNRRTRTVESPQARNSNSTTLIWYPNAATHRRRSPRPTFLQWEYKPPQEKFNIPDKINGIAMQAFFAGRAECLIRRTPVPVTYVDFHAQFPAVSSLLNCREILCAESLEFADFTARGAGDGGTRNPGRLSSAQNSGSSFAGSLS